MTKTGGGTLTLAGNNLLSGTTRLAEGTIIVSNGVLSGPLSLSNGTTAVAIGGRGLVGAFYGMVNGPGTGGQPNPNFASLSSIALLFATNNPTMLYDSWGTGANFDFGGTFPTPYQDNIAVLFIGKFIATNSGTHIFGTASDDGSMLWIDGSLLVNNNFYQGVTTRTGSTNLNAGAHDIIIGYYEHNGGQDLKAYITPPGATASNLLPNAQLFSGPGVGTLSGDAGSALVISNGLLTIMQTSDGIFNGSVSGPGGIFKTGTNILSLAGANSFSDSLVIASGPVRIDGSLSSCTSIVVQTTGILGGTGTVGTVATVQDNGRINPASPGTIGQLTIATPNFLSNSYFTVDLNATTSDVLAVSGTLAASNALVEVNGIGALANQFQRRFQRNERKQRKNELENRFLR